MDPLPSQVAAMLVCCECTVLWSMMILESAELIASTNIPSVSQPLTSVAPTSCLDFGSHWNRQLLDGDPGGGFNIN